MSIDAKEITNKTASFAEWAEELNRITVGYYGLRGAVAECGEDSWRDFYDNGDTPEQALAEDMMDWDDDGDGQDGDYA